MSEDRPRRDEPEQGEQSRHLEELRAQVAANRTDIEALLASAEANSDRASAAARAAEEQDRRIDRLEARGRVDQEMIAELQAEGLLSREHAHQLEEALRSSRTIGAAIGIVMATRNVSEEVAFEILKRGSQHANRKVRVVADEVVRTGDVSQLPDV